MLCSRKTERTYWKIFYSMTKHGFIWMMFYFKTKYSFILAGICEKPEQEDVEYWISIYYKKCPCILKQLGHGSLPLVNMWWCPYSLGITSDRNIYWNIITQFILLMEEVNELLVSGRWHHVPCFKWNSVVTERILFCGYFISKDFWPPRFSDLISPNFYLWGFLKWTVFSNNTPTYPPIPHIMHTRMHAQTHTHTHSLTPPPPKELNTKIKSEISKVTFQMQHKVSVNMVEAFMLASEMRTQACLLACF